MELADGWGTRAHATVEMSSELMLHADVYSVVGDAVASLAEEVAQANGGGVQLAMRHLGGRRKGDENAKDQNKASKPGKHGGGGGAKSKEGDDGSSWAGAGRNAEVLCTIRGDDVAAMAAVYQRLSALRTGRVIPVKVQDRSKLFPRRQASRDGGAFQ